MSFLCMQVLANFLTTPLASGVDGDALKWSYVGFDLDPSVVKVSENIIVLHSSSNGFFNMYERKF